MDCNALPMILVRKPLPNKPLNPSTASITLIVSAYVIPTFVADNACFVVLMTLIKFATVSLTIDDKNPTIALRPVVHGTNICIASLLDSLLYV
eukprot:scaffold27070_cov147-Skeletonema_menzelii.AAC.6